MDRRTSRDLAEGRSMPASDAELVWTRDPLELLAENEFTLRPAAGVGWEAGYFDDDGGVALGKGATPAEAIRRAAQAVAENP